MSEVLGATITPPAPREADDVASAEYAALVADARAMSPELTGLPTDCAGWSGAVVGPGPTCSPT